MRKHYYIVLDTETANGLEDPLVYDIGFAVIDRKGTVYETRSFIIKEIWDSKLMNSAYYANKIPNYQKDIDNGNRKVVPYYFAKKELHELCEKYSVKSIMAHNMRFDYNATATTQRYLTKSKFRFFFPYGIELWDTLKMAQDTVCKQKKYQKWCSQNGYLTKNGKPRATAEILYRYLSKDNEFVESHTGLEDVLIESQIFTWCVRQHKSMRKLAFNG